MGRIYKQVKFTPGDTIEQVVDKLLKYRNEGKLVCGEFNGVTLYSDTVTIDSAYRLITGKSKAEFDKYYRIL